MESSTGEEDEVEKDGTGTYLLLLEMGRRHGTEHHRYM